MNKNIVIIMIVLGCVGVSRASLSEIRFMLYDEVLDLNKVIVKTTELIPELEGNILRSKLLLQEHKDRYPTMYYVDGKGFKREAKDPERSKLQGDYDESLRRLKNSLSLISDTNTDILKYYNLIFRLSGVKDEDTPKFLEKLKKDYIARKLVLDEEVKKEVDIFIESGKYSEKEALGIVGIKTAEYNIRKVKKLTIELKGRLDKIKDYELKRGKVDIYSFIPHKYNLPIRSKSVGSGGFFDEEGNKRQTRTKTKVRSREPRIY